ncbi:MAG TPA: MarR family transcriptional regulator [Bryobacteraceae bacterium]|nr:MarR family transcriptional regulator [Bryobacteraceae bacterium]
MERPAIRRLQQEIQQTKPFVNSQHAAGLSLLRTADQARREFDSLVSPMGISVEQYNVLRILRGAGEKGLPTLEIAARLLEQNPGITRLLDKLEAKGLVCRARCATDRRQVFCTITADGAAIVNSLDEPARRQNQQFFRGLSAAEVDTLIDLLDRLRYPETKAENEREI